MKKKIMSLLAITMLFTGCSVNYEKKYNDIAIGDKVESHQLDLRIYGSIGEEKINEIYKIDNYKNEDYTILTNDGEYYIVNGITYKENGKISQKSNKSNIFDLNVFDIINKGNGIAETQEEVLTITYEKVEDKIFHDTDLLLKGLKNIKSSRKVKNDIVGLDLDAYKVRFDKKYVKELLEKLGYKTEEYNAKGKVYIKEDQVYKIVFNIDDLTISAGIFRINGINEINIDFE